MVTLPLISPKARLRTTISAAALLLLCSATACGSGSSASGSAPAATSGAGASGGRAHSSVVTSTPSAVPVGPPPTRLHTAGAQILDAHGEVFGIKGANWFGMETAACAPDGLWQISLDSGMAEIRSFGFNTVRLPFSSQCLEQTKPATGIDAGKNPELQNKTPLQIMDAVIASAKSHGLRVILDRHRPDSGGQSELWYTPGYPESKWIADWVMLAKRYVDEPDVVGADLNNEPHGTACWGCGVKTRDWAAAAQRAGDAIQAVDPHLLIVVEGIEKSAAGTYAQWGGELQDVQKHRITLKVADQLIYSAHDYPASVTPQPWFEAADYPANLPGIWDKNFGFIAKQKIAPVLLGEFGTKLQTSSDKEWMQAIVLYLKESGISFVYRSFNPDSGDTGGLVTDDWVTPQAAKLAALAPLLTPATIAASSVPASRVPASTAASAAGG